MQMGRNEIFPLHLLYFEPDFLRVNFLFLMQ
jgi:hypothetical protein